MKNTPPRVRGRRSRSLERNTRSSVKSLLGRNLAGNIRGAIQIGNCSGNRVSVRPRTQSQIRISTTSTMITGNGVFMSNSTNGSTMMLGNGTIMSGNTMILGNGTIMSGSTMILANGTIMSNSSNGSKKESTMILANGTIMSNSSNGSKKESTMILGNGTIMTASTSKSGAASTIISGNGNGIVASSKTHGHPSRNAAQNPLRRRKEATSRDSVAATDNNLISDVIEILDEPLDSLNSFNPFDSFDHYEDNILRCPVCFDPVRANRPMMTFCGHVFCGNCIRKSVEIYKKCPTCQKPLKMSELVAMHI